MSENYSDPELDNNLLSILNQESMHSQPGPNQPNPNPNPVCHRTVSVLILELF